MDSFGLRQEQSELLKSVSELKNKLDISEKKISELHDEEMRYLKEIPEYKKQADKARFDTKGLVAQFESISKEVKLEQIELVRLQGLVATENQALKELKITEEKIIEENKLMNEQLKQRHEKLKERESNISETEKLCDIRESKYKEIESDLDKREFNISKLENEFKDKASKLSDDIDAHNNNVSTHAGKVDALIQAKEIHMDDEKILAHKSSKVDRLIKDNTELKAALLLQSDKLSKEITITQGKQVSLDRALADLVNQENILKIKDLKIKKMAHDAGLEKELKDLEASLK